MSLSPISPITLEGQPQELTSFLRSGVLYVLWNLPINDTGLSRLHWKPHTGLDFTEVVPSLSFSFHNVSAVYHPATDQLVVVWDDSKAVVNSVNGDIYYARFNVLTGALISGPTVLFQGSSPRLSYRTTPGDHLLLYYLTAKSGGVYGRLSVDGGLTWQSGEPIITNQVLKSLQVEVIPYDSGHVSIAQIGGDPRGLSEIGMLQRTRPISSIVGRSTGHLLDANSLALWRFDETSGAVATDFTSGGRNLTLNGTHTVVAGQFGNARQFLNTSGNNANRAGDAALAALFIGGGYTFEAWIKVDLSAVSLNVASIFSYSGTFGGGEPHAERAALFVQGVEGRLLIEWEAPTATYTYTANGTILTNTWTHVGLRVADVGGGMRRVDFFINGVQSPNTTAAIVAQPQAGTAASCQLWIGQAFTNDIYHLPGFIDDTRLSNVLRTDAEILASYRGSKDFYIGEPSKFDNTTLIDNLRGALVLATDNSKLFHLDGVVQGTSDTVGAVALLAVSGTTITVSASAGPTGNGDDINSYTLTPAAGALNVDLPGASFAVGLDVSAGFGYIAEYADNSAVLGQFIVVNLSSGATGTVFTGVTGVRGVAVANFLATPTVFVASTESGFERLRVYQENALTPTLLLNTKLPARANRVSVTTHPTNPTGVRVLVSMVDRFNIYDYTSAAAPITLFDSYQFSGGGQFFKSVVTSNGNFIIAAGNAGVLVLTPTGKVRAQIQVSGKVVPEWTPTTVFTSGQKVRPRSRHQFTRNRYYFNCSVGGTSGSAEPSWALTGTVLDSGAQWTPVGTVDGTVTDVAIDEAAARIYAVGVAGGDLGTDGRVWVLAAGGLL